ncbi:MAG: hypothetical protein AUJ92_07955 [Armatimonadetes bacterium CG2_30_59_28]|nr:MAG: hypothetical protein AUJ92_07955 [Armatimonadetes bacterium CG2_30_59_28]PJB69669.1 MAG: hypothetical protein CO095_09710 [Armatimonadetes bacterium CG_4_9_14_3_um_filter_58_7]
MEQQRQTQRQKMLREGPRRQLSQGAVRPRVGGLSASGSAAFLAMLLLLSSVAAQQDDFRKLLEQGREAISQARYEVAIDTLQRATRANPESAYAHHLLGLAFRGLENPNESTRHLCLALKKDPVGAEIRASLAEALKVGLPREMTDETLKTLQEVYYEGAWEAKDWEFQTAIQYGVPATKSYQALSTTETLFPPKNPQRDPLHAKSTLNQLPDAWKFNRVTYGYLRARGAENWSQQVRVYYVSEFLARGAQNYAALSEMICRMALQVNAVVRDNMGANPPPAEPVINIWLCEEGEVGARQPIDIPGHIYFYDITHHRPWVEWLRQLVHEYGHLVLPAIGGFTSATEPIADGEMGERLFMPWVRASMNLTPDAYRPEDRDQVDGYVLSKSEQCLNLFLEEGPESPLLFDRGSWGVQLLCGFALWVSRTHDPSFLQRCFVALAEQGDPMDMRSVDFRDTYQKLWIANSEKGLDYRASLPSSRFTVLSPDAKRGEPVTLKQGNKAGFWAYLVDGTWRVYLGLADGASGVLTLSWSGEGYEEHGLVLNPAEQARVELEEVSSGWRAVIIEAKNLPKPVQLQRLRFSKADAPPVK